MKVFTAISVLFGVLGIAYCAPSEVTCPAPKSPEHGQAFLYQEGKVIKFACEPGYALRGKDLIRCINGQWEDPYPACVEIGANSIKENPEDSISEPLPPLPPPRSLFSWDSDNEENREVNSTSDETPLSDEARVRLLMYPRRRMRVVTSTVHTGKLQSATELEEEEKKRSQDGKPEKGGTSTTIHLGSHPSVLYVTRTSASGKSEAARKALDDQYKTASLHMTVDNGHDVELVSLPRATVSLDGKELSEDQALRQLYWHAYYNYPRHASLIDYRTGAPVTMTLTESQLNWINSLHPDLRDQYLKDLYTMRAEEIVEGEKAQAFLRRYEDAYNYHVPYLRQPVSLIMEDPIATYDYTCHESGYPFIKAPKLRNMHIHRYDRRQNPNNPHNHYLAAVYRCNPGYVMADTRFTELYCSKKGWTGARPVCVPRG